MSTHEPGFSSPLTHGITAAVASELVVIVVIFIAIICSSGTIASLIERIAP